MDAKGRLSLCCQLSEYGFAETDVVADLNATRFADAWGEYVARLGLLQARARRPPRSTDPLDALPCIRCARACGKMEWIGAYPESEWSRATAASAGAARPLVQIGRPRATAGAHA